MWVLLRGVSSKEKVVAGGFGRRVEEEEKEGLLGWEWCMWLGLPRRAAPRPGGEGGGA